MPSLLSSQELIARLRAARQAVGKSAQAVADETGIPRSTIANMETGRRSTIDVSDAVAICSAIGVDLRVMLSDEPMPIATQVWVI